MTVPTVMAQGWALCCSGLLGEGGSKATEVSRNREPRKPQCCEVISAEFPGRGVLPPGVFDHGPYSNTRQEAHGVISCWVSHRSMTGVDLGCIRRKAEARGERSGEGEQE